ncbi:hypothetical protein V2J09_016491 [Rumex salicifolius]
MVNNMKHLGFLRTAAFKTRWCGSGLSTTMPSLTPSKFYDNSKLKTDSYQEGESHGDFAISEPN